MSKFKMASSLSDEEFQRMQLQLIELRTTNYSLEDKCNKQERELTQLKGLVENLQKETDKATKAVSKSKKAKEFELLMQENESLQRKLMSQEDEFRLQNETLMQELNRLVTVNEGLENEKKSLEQSGSAASVPAPAEAAPETEAELLRLQALNTALQKNLTETKERYEVELSRLRREPVDGEDQRTEGDGASVDTAAPITSSGNDGESRLEIESLTKQVNDLQLNTDVQQEENRLLRTQLENLKKDTSEQIRTLQEEVEKVTLKFKKKQESFVQLQEEKEKQYSDLSTKLEDLQKAKQAEVGGLHAQCERLHSELAKANKSLDEYKTQNEHKMMQLEGELKEANEKVKRLEQQERAATLRVQELEEMCASLEEEVDEGNAEQQQEMEAELGKMQRKLQYMAGQLEAAKSSIEDLTVQLKESQQNHAGAVEQLTALQKDRDAQIAAVQETHRVAERRKALLDELAIRLHDTTEQHRQATQTAAEEHARTVDKLSSQMAQLKKSLEEKHSAEVGELTAEISALKLKAAELQLVKQQAEEVSTELRSVQEAKLWLERRLPEVEANLEEAKKEHEEALSSMETEHQAALETLREQHQQNVQELQEEVNGVNEEKVALDTRIQELQQEIQDGLDARKIHEKKGMTVVRDLKKQLHAEKKRVEKLQERLQELLADSSRGRQSVEELLRNDGSTLGGSSSTRGDDHSSMSSWSGLSKDPTASSPDDDPDSTSSQQLQHDNSELLQRLAQQQHHAWQLEEKVSHLESSNAAMADDLLKKTAIIEHYVMDSRTSSSSSSTPHHTNNIASSPSQDKLTSLKRMVDFVKGENDDNMRDMNRKLQRMLEETLTKNMHLQQDMETLSQEVVRLSKTAVSPTP